MAVAGGARRYKVLPSNRQRQRLVTVAIRAANLVMELIDEEKQFTPAQIAERNHRLWNEKLESRFDFIETRKGRYVSDVMADIGKFLYIYVTEGRTPHTLIDD